MTKNKTLVFIIDILIFDYNQFQAIMIALSLPFRYIFLNRREVWVVSSLHQEFTNPQPTVFMTFTDLALGIVSV